MPTKADRRRLRRNRGTSDDENEHDEELGLADQIKKLTAQVSALAGIVAGNLPNQQQCTPRNPTVVTPKNSSFSSTPVVPAVSAVSITIDLSRDLPSYDGSNNVEAARTWLDTWRNVIAIHNLPDKAAIELARRSLEDSAKSWYTRNYQAGRFDSVDSFQRLFKSVFVPHLDTVELTRRMLARTQQSAEEPMHYLHDKLRLITPLKLPLPEIRKYLVEGLRWSALASHILTAPSSDEEDLLRIAREFIHCQSSSTSVVSSRPKETSRPSKTTVSVASTSSSSNASATTQPSNKVITASPKCYNCFEYGHLSRDCSQPRRTPKCTACGKMGHVKSKCSDSFATVGNAVTSPSTKTATTNSVVALVNNPFPSAINKYQRLVNVCRQPIKSQIDPGSSDCLMRLTDATRLNLTTYTCRKTFYGIGPTQDKTEARSFAVPEIEIDGIAFAVPVYIVPDECIPIPFVIGRTWTERPEITYARVGDDFRFMRLDDYTIREFAQMVEAVRQDASSTSIQLKPYEPIVIGSSSTFVGYIAADPNQTHDSCVLMISKDGNYKMPTVDDELWVPFQLSQLTTGSDLTESERSRLLQLVNAHRRAFATNVREIGCTELVKMDITEIPGSTPCAQRPYRTTADGSRTMADIVKQYCEVGLAEPCTSPYAAPALLVDKKTGDKRIVFDYRKLNAQTVNISYPLPNIDDVLAQLSNAQYYTVLDLYSGYLQVKLNPTSRDKTAFVIPSGQYRFLRMPMGLKNAPAIFQSLMNQVLGNMPRRVAFCYLDDIVIPARTFEEMLENISAVLTALQAAGLTCRLSKCEFAMRRIEYLGFEIENGQIKPGTRKTQAIADFPCPKDVHEVRRFLGLTGFFRRFVRQYAIIANPLSSLLKKNASFKWTDSQANAFQTLKAKITSSPVLRLYDPKAPIEVHTDASAIGVGGMLIQLHEGKSHLVYAVSKHCTSAEALYHSSRLELLAIIWTLSRLRQFLLGATFTVVTDCQCLTYLHKAKVGNGQLARWAVLLSEYDCTFRHRPGTSMAHVDALSRAPTETSDQGLEEEIVSRVMYIDVVDEIRTFQSEDTEIKNLLRYIQLDGANDPESRKYTVENGILYRLEGPHRLFVVPRSMRKAIVIKFHDQLGHYSTEKVVAAITRQYWFTGMRRYVNTHIRRCLPCITNKGPSGRGAGLLQPIPPADQPFLHVHADHLGPLPTSPLGDQHVLVIVDSLTRYVELYACNGTTAAETIKHFTAFVCRHGLPARIVTDRGTAFTANAFADWCDQNNIQHIRVSTRHPRGNGLVERVNRVLTPQLAIYCQNADRTDWPSHLDVIRRNINAAVNRSTGRSPCELLYGFHPRFVELVEDSTRNPNRMRAEAITRTETAQAKQKRYFDRKHCRGETLSVGQIVFAKAAAEATGMSTKLQPRYRGPLVVVKRIAQDTYRCQSLNTEGTILDTNFHISALRVWGEKIASDEEPEDSPLRSAA